jgi:hypothetical protein
MIRKSCAWLSLAFGLFFLTAGSASAGGVLWCLHPDGADYSACHYRFPTLYRLKACIFGVSGMPVSVHPPADDETDSSAAQECPAAAIVPATPVPSAPKSPTPVPSAPKPQPKKKTS